MASSMAYRLAPMGLWAGCLLAAGLCGTAPAATFTWTGQGGGAGWYATARIPDTDPPRYINNFGQSPPAWPGPGDDAIVAGAASVSDGDVTILNLTTSNLLGTGGGHTLNVLQDLLNTGILNVHSGDAATPIVLVGGTLTNAAGGTVDVHYHGVLAAQGTSIVNDGAIWLNNNTGMGDGRLRVDNNVVLSGTGTLHCGCDIYSLTGHTLTNGPGHVIAYGRGSIRAALVNDGTVNANRSGDAISLRDAPKTNNNLMQAAGDAYLDIYTTIGQGLAGRIVADGGTVRLRGGSVAGGTLNTAGSSRIVTYGGTTSGIADLVNAGYLWVQNNGSVLAVSGSTIVNNGTIELTHNTGMGDGEMRVDSTVHLAGTGQLLCGARIFGSGALINDADHTIRHGCGDFQALLTNEGTVNADRSGYELYLTTAAKTNNALFTATNNATLGIYTTVNQGPAGRIVADGGTVLLSNCTIEGGTLDSAGTSKIQVAPDRTATIRGLVNEGYLWAPNNGSTLALAGGVVTNNGTIQLTKNTGMGSGEMRLDGDVLLDGNGELLCSARIYASGAFALTNGPAHTIRNGQGTVEAALINEGTVDADRAGESISLTGAAKTNNGLMKAGNGAYLDIYTTVTQGPAGRIVADGGTVRLRGGAIQGGTLATTGASRMETVTGTTTTLADLTNDGYILAPNNGSTLAVAGTTITNNGTIELKRNTGMGHGQMRLDADVSFDGTGVIQPKSLIFTDSGSTLTNKPGHRIEGTGSINVDCLNQGVIRANGNGTLAINPQAVGSANEGIIEIIPGSTLSISNAGLFAQRAGCILAGGDLGVSGGPLNCQGGMLRGTGPVNGGLTNVSARIEPGSAVGTLRITGAYLQGAAASLCIDLAGRAAGEFDVLQVGGVAGLGGELHVRAIRSFIPAVGEEFTILTTPSRTGEFASVSGSGQYEVIYATNSVKIRVVASPNPGDIDGSGSVDVVDLLWLIDAFGAVLTDSAYNPDCDLDGDGVVDVIDLLTLIDFWPA